VALILKRKVDQDVVITASDGQVIRIRVANIAWPPNRWPAVSLSIDAPRDWTIHREELQPHRATA
jgi:sRNA-binding carbon storage regulator CsrA